MVPFAPSAPTIASADHALARSERHRVAGLDLRPSRPPAPRPRARARRRAGTRRAARRCVIQTTGSACACTTARRSGSGARPRSTSSSTTGVGSTGHWRTARIVSPPPHGLSRGKRRLVGEQHGRALPRRAGTRSSTRPARRRPRSRRSASQAWRLQCRALPGVCPSGQRERAVNPSAQPTEVRILPPPLQARSPVVKG